MSIIDFVKAAGRALGISKEEAAPSAEDIAKELQRLGIGSGVKVEIEADTVILTGEVPSQKDKEILVLVAGNTYNVAKVDDRIQAKLPAEQSIYYEVKRGDTLSHIAQNFYGDEKKYMLIFEANRPMLKNPDDIYPCQKLRIPPPHSGNHKSYQQGTYANVSGASSG